MWWFSCKRLIIHPKPGLLESHLSIYFCRSCRLMYMLVRFHSTLNTFFSNMFLVLVGISYYTCVWNLSGHVNMKLYFIHVKGRQPSYFIIMGHYNTPIAMHTQMEHRHQQSSLIQKKVHGILHHQLFREQSLMYISHLLLLFLFWEDTSLIYAGQN